MKNSSNRNELRKSTGAGLLLIIVAALTLEATSLLQNYFSRKGMMEEAQMRAEGQLEATRLQIIDVTHQAEAAVRNSIWIARWCLDYPDSLVRVATRIVEDNPTVMGSTLALIPNYSLRRPLYAPYVCREADSLVTKSLATPEYDYPSQEWFKKPLELGRGFWSEPYIDVGGGNVLMTTYSVPIYDNKGKKAAVLTADISLQWLAQLINNSMAYPNSFEVVISRGGQVLVSAADGQMIRSSIDEVARNVDDTSSFARMIAAMRSNQSGNITVNDDGKDNQVFYAPVEQTGWSMAVVVPDDEIYGDLRRVRFIERLFQLLGLGMLVLILRITAKNQQKYHKINEKKERMEGELQIGRNIQMSMIPNTFPPFPERHDIDLAACLIPAKEVGGDLYDFYIVLLHRRRQRKGSPRLSGNGCDQKPLQDGFGTRKESSANSYVHERSYVGHERKQYVRHFVLRYPRPPVRPLEILQCRPQPAACTVRRYACLGCAAQPPVGYYGRHVFPGAGDRPQI